MDAIDFLLGQHARLHSAAVAESEAGSLEDDLLGGLDDEETREAGLPGLNPPAWTWWHLARCEDVLVNTVVADRAQVFDGAPWPDRLGVARRDIGTGMTGDEVADLVAAIDVSALRKYRAAVGTRSREVIRTLSDDELDRPVGPDAPARARDVGAFGPDAGWVVDAWHGTTLGFLLGRNLLTHNALHVGEAIVAGPRSV